MKYYLLIPFFAFQLFFSTKAFSAVWENENQWTPSMEKKYQDWVKKSFTQEIFFTSGPYKEIETDCADASYGMRLIFAYENKLPFVIKDSTDSRKFITNNISKFDHISDSLARFRAFASWVMDMTSTGSLSYDTYPVAISREQIVPGIIYLATKTHSYQIIELTSSGVPVLQSSTTPRQVRTLSRVTTFPHYVPGEYKPRKYADGFRKFRNPDQFNVSDASLPGYSLEQFTVAESMGGLAPKFYDWVIQQLQTQVETIEDKTYRYVVALCYTAWDRAEAVYDAQNYIKKIAGRCMNASEYDLFSTPGRDKKLKTYFDYLNQLTNDSRWRNQNSRYKDFVQVIINRAGFDRAGEEDLIKFCDVNRQVGGPARPMSLAELYRIINSGNFISDPNASVAERWGLASYSPRCQQY